MTSNITCKECACSIRDGEYYPCKQHELGLPYEIRKWMKDSRRTWGS